MRLSDPTLLTPATYLLSDFDSELEVLIGTETLCIHAVLSDLKSPSGLNQTSQLLDADDEKLGRFQWSEADENINDALIDAVLRSRLRVTYDELRVI